MQTNNNGSFNSRSNPDNPNRYSAANSANNGGNGTFNSYRNAYRAFVAFENNKTKYFAAEQHKRDELLRKSLERNAVYQKTLEKQEEARKALKAAKRAKAEATTIHKLEAEFTRLSNLGDAISTQIEGRIVKALHYSELLNKTHAEQADYYDSVINGMSKTIQLLNQDISDTTDRLNDIQAHNDAILKARQEYKAAIARGEDAVAPKERLNNKGVFEAQRELASLQSQLAEQQTAYNNIYETGIRMRLLAEEDAYNEKLKEYAREQALQHRLYEERTQLRRGEKDEQGRDTVEEYQQQVTFEQKRHELAVANMKLEHQQKLDSLKRDHELRMEELREELKESVHPLRRQSAVDAVNEQRMQTFAKNTALIATNNDILSDQGRYLTMTEKWNLLNESDTARRENNRIFKNTYGKQRKDAYEQLSVKSGKSVEDIKKMFKEGLTAEFEDRDGDLVKIIKDANAAEQAMQEAGGSLTDGLLNSFVSGGVGGFFKQLFSNLLGKVAGTVANALSKVSEFLTQKIDPYLSTYYQYQSKLMTRLNGADHTYDSIYKLVKSNIGMSPIVTQTKVMEKVADLVEQGIVQNLEERALLMAIGDKLVTTFEADNENLLRLIRLQQKDSTNQYMGMEGILNKLLNQWFKDTSYLSTEFDNIEGLLMDLDSTMTDSVGINFAIQKWMAALSSMGASSSTLERLTQGLVYLGTGDVNALAGAQDLQSLFALVANKQNLDYAKLLNEGVREADINTLMRGVVKYIDEINTSSTNIIKAQYQDLFNMTRADFEAISNLAQSSKFSAVYSAYATSASSKMWVDDQVNSITDRMHLSERIDNLVENMFTSIATGISDSTGKYVAYRLQGALADAGIPVLSQVAQIAQLVPIATSIVGAIGTVSSAVSNPFRLNLKSWEQSNFESRGRASAATSAPSGASTATSASYSSSINSGVASNVFSRSTEFVGSSANLSEQIDSVASSMDSYGKTFANYNEELNSALSYSSSSLRSTSSLTTANAISAVSTASAETAKQTDTLGELYRDLFKKNIHVIPDSGTWSSLLSNASVNISTASVENISKTLSSVNKIMNSSSTSIDVRVTNSEIKTMSTVSEVSDKAQTLLTTLIMNALIKAKAQETNDRARDASTNDKLTLEDLITKIVNGDVNVNVTNPNFDTAVSRYLMES